MKNLIKHSFEKVDLLYYFLATLRLFLTLVPQRGYIHPDEFFQSVEVMAGDVFDVESNPPWEFNSTFPIRSIFTPFVMIGIPYKCLLFLDYNLQFYFNLNLSLRTPYWLLVVPRLYQCVLSFAIDFSLYKICKINCEKFQNKLLLLASSYVIQVYGTHTFSNTVEMILISLLLYLVVDSQTYSHAIIRQDVYLSKKYNKSRKPADKARIYKIKASLPSYTTRNCILISFIIVLGVFNRPTFVCFAFPSVFFWIHRGIGFKIMNYSDIHYRMLLFILNSVLFATFFIIIDSFYFGYLSGIEVLEMDMSFSNFVVTPLNFIKYNMDSSKLAEHGLHPRITHLLVNIPILYNILGIIGIGGLIVVGYRLASGHFTGLPKIHSIQFLMSASIIFPVATLSYFPHQEPRFLIPITLPLIYLYADVIMSKKYLKRLWWTSNILSLVFFGFVHQAGLVPLASYMNNQLQGQVNQPIHLVTSHVYSFPVSLLMQRNSRRLYGQGSSKYQFPKTFMLYEMGSSHTASIMKHFSIIHHIHVRKNLSRNITDYKTPSMYLALPVSKEHELYDFILHESNMDLHVDRVKTFYPHISTEAMPNLFYNPCESEDLVREECSTNNYSVISVVSSFVYNVAEACGLGLYKVYIKPTQL